jgi:hypothetical protein
MELVTAGRVVAVTIHASSGQDGGEWTAGEAWPVHLSLGVTVRAPDVFFVAPHLDSGLSVDAFLIQQFDALDESTVTIEGDPNPDGGYVHIGIPVGGESLTDVFDVGIADYKSDSLAGLTPLPVVVSHAWIQANAAAVWVGPYGALTVGPNPVHVGTWDGRVSRTGGGAVGLACQGLPWAPAYVADVGGAPLQIDSQTTGISAGDDCQLTLEHGPTIGRSPDGGYNSCPSDISDEGGIVIGGAASATLGSQSEPATIQCQRGSGITLGQSLSGRAPSVYFIGTIKNIACFGLNVHAGYAAAYATDLSYCNTAVWAADSSSVDLSGDLGGVRYFPSNRVFCTSSMETEGGAECGYWGVSGAEELGPDGTGLANFTSSTVRAENVLWSSWDAAADQPPLWVCQDATLEDCTCQSGGCPDGGASHVPLTLGATAVYLAGNPQPFSFDGGGLYDVACQ